MIQIVAILSLAIYGSIISLLIGLKLNLAERLNISDSKAGMLFSSFMLCGAISVVVLSSSIDFLGHATVTIFGFFFTALALLLLAFCKTYKQVLSMYIIMSIGAMCIVSVGNTLLPHVLFGGQNASAATNLGNGFYGVGACLVSYYITNLLQKRGYKWTVLFFSGLLLLCAVLSLFAKYPVIYSDFSFSNLSAVLTSSFFIVAIITNFFGAGVENGVGAWANTYMSRLGSTEKQANTVLSLFFVAIMVSRLVMVTFVTPANTPTVLLVIAVLVILTLALLMSTNKKEIAIGSIMALGLLLGAVCPNIFGYMFSKIDPAFHGTSFGICFSIGLAGASVIPGLIGFTSKRSSLKKAFAINIVGAGLFGASALIMLFL